MSYQLYLLGLFNTIGFRKQRLIIQFDQTFQMMLANDVQLTFDDIESRHSLLFTMVRGLTTNSWSGRTNIPKRPRRGSTKICHWYNAGKDHVRCTYLHVCDRC